MFEKFISDEVYAEPYLFLAACVEYKNYKESCETYYTGL